MGTLGRHLGMAFSSAGQPMRPGGCLRKGARPGLRALPVSSPVSQCMLLLPGLSSSPQARLSPPRVPSGPSKADFPCWRASSGGLQPGDRWEAREAGSGWGGQWASIWARGGCWAPANNWTENSPALTCRPEAACGSNHTQSENLPCTSKPTRHKTITF